MNSNLRTTAFLKDRKKILSLLWIFAMFNYLYADVLTLMDTAMLNQIISGTAPVKMTPGALFAAALLMETAIMMILLSRLLNYKANRLFNIIIGILHTVAVFASMFAGKPASYYLLYGIIEMACTCFIVWYAWSWKKLEENQ